MTVAHAAHPSDSAPHAGLLSPGLLAVPGRILLSIVFLLSGFAKVANFSYMAGFIASKGAPAPKVLLAIAAAAELAGGLSVLLGLWSRVGALGLFVYLIPTTLMFHNFWAVTGPEHMDVQIHFLKNLAIMGGLLMVAAYGPGPLSIDAAKRRH